MAGTTSDSNDYIVKFEKIMVKGFLITAVSYALNLFIAPFLWERNIYLTHTVMELICIYIALSSFSIIWNSYQETVEAYYLVGLGFLSVAIFDCFHTYYWIMAEVAGQAYKDLTIKYWVIGRLTEALLFAAVSMRLGKHRLNKWAGLSSILAGSVVLSLVIMLVPGFFPVMFSNGELTRTKIILEYAIVALSVFSLYKLRDDLENDSDISYKYIFMALLFVIPEELCFTLYKEDNIFYNAYGHVLKIICYYYLYLAVYVSCVEYPYKRLAEAYAKLEEKNIRINEISCVMNDTLDALPIGILNLEADRKINYMNKRLEEILACNRNELYGLTVEEFLEEFPSGEKEEESIIELNNVKRNNTANMIRTCKNKANEYVKLTLTSQDIRKGMIIYFNEVKKEQEISNFHLQTQTILNAVNNCVLMTDQNRKIVLYNEALKKIFETNGTDLIGMSLDKFNKSIDLRIKGQYESMQEDVFLKPREVSITTLKGNKKELLAYVDHIRNIENEIIGAISVFTDITEINRQNHSMQQQEKLALIGQMAAGIIHEIKNPLATIKGLSQLITARSNVDKIKEYSAVINASIDDITKVVNEFLSFAKPKPTVKVRTGINRIVRSMQLIIETQCYTKNIKTQFGYPSFDMEITADEIKIKQVILNITENAIAAMESTRLPELTLLTRYNADAGEGIIEIADNGTGMKAEVLEKLGTPFFTTKEKGTGLGLGICYQIMNEHNGRIEVESEVGKGTVFKIIFSQIENLL